MPKSFYNFRRKHRGQETPTSGGKRKYSELLELKEAFAAQAELEERYERYGDSFVSIRNDQLKISERLFDMLIH